MEGEQVQEVRKRQKKKNTKRMVYCFSQGITGFLSTPEVPWFSLHMHTIGPDTEVVAKYLRECERIIDKEVKKNLTRNLALGSCVLKQTEPSAEQ
jgi:hypothetical protein